MQISLFFTPFCCFVLFSYQLQCKIFSFVVIVVLFAIFLGGIVLAAYDQVPFELHDNSLILGCLSFFVAIVMLFDLADPMARHVTDTTQTETRYLQSGTADVQLQIQPNTTQLASTTSNDKKEMNIIPGNIPNNTIEDSRAIHKTEVHNHTNNHHRHQQQQQHQQFLTTPQSSPEVKDITKNGNYHRGDNIDFVQMQNLPRAEQPVFERVLLPEKSRPTFNKISDPNENVAARNVHSVSHSMHSSIDNNAHDHHYAHQHHQYQRQPHHKMHLQTSLQPYQNYAYEEYDEHSDNQPPRYVLKTNGTAMTNRYHDIGEPNAPMMVIRNYSKPIQNSAYGSKRVNSNQSKMLAQNNRLPHNKIPDAHTYSQTKKMSKNKCCNDEDGDDEVDFRKINAPIRPGFVANAAKMWDQRASEQSNELNTIV